MFVNVLHCIYWRMIHYLSQSIITLCRNDRHIRKSFDSVAVSESISSSVTNLSSRGLPVFCFHHFTRFPLKRICRQCSFLRGTCGRRRRRHHPFSRSCAGFAWRSGCRAQRAARCAGGGRKRRQGRTGRSRRGESRTQGETHMNMDDKWRDSDVSHEVHVRQDEQGVTKIVRSQCMLRWCACWACRCSCCSWSHACPHCLCHCCSFCRRVFVASFLF